MSSERIPEYSERVNSMYSSLIIGYIIVRLEVIIDQLDIHFARAKNLILELARELDEAKQCKQSQICRKIKELLEDKIKEGKISEKWIEECLPQEYKRKYTKSELSSLSKQGNSTDEQERENDLIATDSGGPYIKTDDALASDYRGDETAYAANHQLKDGLNKKEITSHIINEIRLTIPKVKFENVKAAMENSKDLVYLIFDKSGILERVESDAISEIKE
jgi:hypothetical protein